MKLEDKKRIAEMYAAGVNAKVIANRLGENYDTVRKYIQRNLKHLKSKHLKEMERDKAILKTTLMECNRAIKSQSFKRYNNSIYMASKSGYIINKKVAPIVTFDTPKIIKSNIY